MDEGTGVQPEVQGEEPPAGTGTQGTESTDVTASDTVVEGEAGTQSRKLWPWLVGVAAVVAVIAIAAGAVFYLWPRAEFAGYEYPDEIVEGELAVVAVELANDGPLGYEQIVALVVDGTVIGEQNVVLDSGERSTFEYELPDTLGAGNHYIALADRAETAGTFVVLTPAEFDAGAITLKPDNPGEDEDVVASLIFRNLGEASGEGTVTLVVDGKSLSATMCALAGGEKLRIELPFKSGSAGVREVAMNDSTAELMVHDFTRPKNGEVFVNKVKGDVGQLVIENGMGSDCLYVLTHKGKKEPVLAVYVRSGEEYKVKRIKDGTYDSYMTDGDKWCAHCKKFMVRAYYEQWDKSMEFDTKYVTSGYTYPIWTIELGSAASGDGDEPVEWVDEADFPGLQ